MLVAEIFQPSDPVDMAVKRGTSSSRIFASMRAVLYAALCVAGAAGRAQFGGLRNQGNTCYLNSLLQTLYHVPKLRSAVIDDAPAPAKRGPLARLRPKVPALALARVFATLRGNSTARTGALTRSLRVSGMQQQDATQYRPSRHWLM